MKCHWCNKRKADRVPVLLLWARGVQQRSYSKSMQVRYEDSPSCEKCWIKLEAEDLLNDDLWDHIQMVQAQQYNVIPDRGTVRLSFDWIDA